MQNRSLSLKLLTPFSSIKLFQFMVTIETYGAFDCMRNPDLKVRVLDLAMEPEMENGLHPHPREILPQIMT